MKSIGFPKMFNTSSSMNVIYDRDAIISNLKTLLVSEKGTLTCDPYFGIRLKRYIYEQNNNVLKDIIIDEIFSEIRTFMPQLLVYRKDIDIVQTEHGKLVANIKLVNKIDYTNEQYSLVIFQNNEEV